MLSSQLLVEQSRCFALHTSASSCRRNQRPRQQRRRTQMHVRAEAAEQEAAPAAPAAEPSPRTCKTCGVDLANAPRGCDNEGHVKKGLGSWPGFGWFDALLVYGPCPEAQKKGIAYTRKGQPLDEIMFGNKGK